MLFAHSKKDLSTIQMLSLPKLMVMYLFSGVLVTSAYAVDTQPQNAQTAETLTNTQNSLDGVIALVNDNAILKSDFQKALIEAQRRYQAESLPLPNAKKLQSDVLNGLVLRELQLSLANRMGIKPKDEIINQRLLQIAKSQGLNSIASLQQTLDRQQAGSYANLRKKVIEDTTIQILQQQQIASRVRITEQDIDDFLNSPEAQQLNDVEYQTIHIRVPYLDDYSRLSESQRQQALEISHKVQELLAQGSLNIEEIMSTAQHEYQYPIPLQGGNMGFHRASNLPIDLMSKIVKLDLGQVSEPMITPQGIDIIQLVNKRSQNRMLVPQWHTRHILIKVDDEQNEEMAKQKINDIYEQLRHGADFSNLASTYSDDIGSAGRGGDLDWVNVGEMVPEFETMMKKTPIGDFSTPFKTQFGWHILQVVDQRQKDMSDEQRRNLAREALFQRLAPQAKEDWLQELRASAYIQLFN